jgi:hypothetical protein
LIESGSGKEWTPKAFKKWRLQGSSLGREITNSFSYVLSVVNCSVRRRKLSRVAEASIRPLTCLLNYSEEIEQSSQYSILLEHTILSISNSNPGSVKLTQQTTFCVVESEFHSDWVDCALKAGICTQRKPGCADDGPVSPSGNVLTLRTLLASSGAAGCESFDCPFALLVGFGRVGPGRCVGCAALPTGLG